MKTATPAQALCIALGLALTGCGGGGGGGSTPAAVTQSTDPGTLPRQVSTSTGTIDGFGSIFVNGVKFETDDSEVSLDGRASTQDKLRLGMVVTVHGSVNDDGRTGTADQVIFDDEVQGPITAIVTSQDGDSLLLTVLGVQVIAERSATVFDGVSFNTLALNDLVEVSGFIENTSQLRATRIEKKSGFVDGDSEVELKGIVAGLNGTRFNLRDVVVDFSGADLSDVPGGSIVDGLPVEVRGTLSGNVIVADRVEREDDIAYGFDDDDDLSVQGAISNFAGAGSFDVNGVAVDATNALLLPLGLVLGDGVIVEVEGVWNGTTLVAQEVKSRRGRVELEAQVAAVDTENGTVTLQFFSGIVTVQVDSTTMLNDDTGQVNRLTLGDITSGNFVEVEAIVVGDVLIATRIQREESDDAVLQAQVASFNSGVDITLLGITFTTAGAKFENQNDRDISSQTFFSQLRVGDLVKIKDEQQQDGIADEVEFEQEDALDGNEFDDDSDDECDNEIAGDDDDCESDDDDDCDNKGPGASDDCESDDDDESDDDCDSDGPNTNDDCESDDDDESDDDCDNDGPGANDDCDSDDESDDDNDSDDDSDNDDDDESDDDDDDDDDDDEDEDDD